MDDFLFFLLLALQRGREGETTNAGRERHWICLGFLKIGGKKISGKKKGSSVGGIP